MKRQRGRSRNTSHTNKNNSNRQMESNGPDTKVRGSATQIHEKYVTLARDAAVSGNRVKAESYRQHAEHYLRLMNVQEAAKQAADAERQARQDAHRPDETTANTNANANTNTNVNANSNNNVNNDEASTAEKRPRRAPQRPRKPREETQEVAENTYDSSEALEVVKPRVKRPRTVKPKVVSEDTEVQVDAETTEEAPRRRRKAPARAKPESETVTAAE